MAKKKKDDIPRLLVPKNATLKQIYAIAKAQFTAADLQKYTVIEKGVPFEKVLKDMEKIHREETRKRNKAPYVPHDKRGKASPAQQRPPRC